jgi:UDP-glucose 4-epimerase
VRVLVTGAFGFVGRHLVTFLAGHGNTVTALDAVTSDAIFPSNVAVIQADITRDELKFDTGFDAVVHLAAMAAPGIAEREPSKTFEVNVRGTFNMLKATKEAGARRFVFASTAHVYGISPRYMPTDEIHPIALQDFYTVSKIMGEELCRLFWSNHHLPYITLRQFNGYGPGQSFDYFIPATIKQAKNGIIHLRGRRIKKDFVYIDDMVDAMWRALNTDFVGELNIGSGTSTALEEVAAIIANHYNVPLSFSEANTPGPTEMRCDRTRAKAILDWSPSFSLEKGLKRTMEAFG